MCKTIFLLYNHKPVNLIGFMINLWKWLLCANSGFSRLVPLLVLAAVVCATTAETRAEDYAQEYMVELGQFTNLKVLDNVNVVYRCSPDTTGVAYFRATPGLKDAYLLAVGGNTLKIQVRTDFVGEDSLPTVFVYSDFLEKVENYADGKVIVERIAPATKFSASLVGNGHIAVRGLKCSETRAKIIAGMGSITLTGETENAILKMTGTGTIQADGLRAANVTCKIFGGGTIGCWPVRLLKTRGVGSTKIYYRGNPEKISHSGGGKILPLNHF